MKMEDQPSSPKDEDILSQTQDPLERRRLQNRLSQRNHRRKIRERIAKLQERVIANELRAAAVLNGWDQGYNTPQFPLRPYSGFPEHDVGLSQRDGSTMTQEQYAPFMPPCPPFSTQSWPTDINSLSPPQSQPLVYSGDVPHYSGTSAASIVSPLTTMPAQSNNCMAPFNPGLGGDAFHELASRGDCLIQKTLPTSANQPLYYVATEAALPQILQVINTMSPQSKVIVLVPPESPASSSITPFPSSSPPYNSGTHAVGNGGLQNLSSQNLSSQNLGCLCHTHNMHSGSPVQSASREWTGTGPYAQTCPLHKIPPSSLPGGDFPVRML